jgi:hypothetical protein
MRLPAELALLTRLPADKLSQQQSVRLYTISNCVMIHLLMVGSRRDLPPVNPSFLEARLNVFTCLRASGDRERFGEDRSPVRPYAQ